MLNGMEKRRFGRTNHMSTVAIFGGAALGNATQATADDITEQVIAAGINHIDIAPSYGHAEKVVGPWIARERERFFLGCKTMERTKAGAWKEMHESLERLQTGTFDLYQFHAVTTLDELDQITAKGGALEAALQAREQGLTKFIGITGHGFDSPAIYLEALRRFDFDTILFPLNFVQYANPTYRKNAEALIQTCRKRDVGTMIIKSVTKRPWGDRPKTHTTWYEPFNTQETVQTAVNFALSQDITGLCTAGDVHVFPLFVEACAKFTPMTTEEQENLIAQADQFEPLFPEKK